jgi:hypothetical protein
MNPQVFASILEAPDGQILHYMPAFCQPFTVPKTRERLTVLGSYIDFTYRLYQKVALPHVMAKVFRLFVEIEHRSLVIDALRADGSSIGGVVFTTNCEQCPRSRCDQGIMRNTCPRWGFKDHPIVAESGTGMLGVDGLYRRNGIATRMYELAFASAKKNRMRIVRSTNLEHDGRLFWDAISNQSWASG